MTEQDHVTDEKRVFEGPANDAMEDSVSLKRRLIETIRSDKLALSGLVVALLFIVTALFAPYVAPHSPDDNFDQFVEPNGYTEGDPDNGDVWHPLGTDSYGRDILTLVLFGARISLVVALGTVTLSFVIGSLVGLAAGYYGGWVDDVLMRTMDLLWTFPTLVIAVAVIAFSGGLGVRNVIIAIGVAYIDDFARLIRGEVLSIKEEPYIKAARTVGMSDWRIMSREIFPNAIAPLIVQATLMIPLAIIIESVLSFLGLGVEPTTPTWGLLIGQGRDFINFAPWISVLPGIAIMTTVLSFNMLGDSIRDAFDVQDDEVEAR